MNTSAEPIEEQGSTKPIRPRATGRTSRFSNWSIFSASALVANALPLRHWCGSGNFVAVVRPMSAMARNRTLAAREPGGAMGRRRGPRWNPVALVGTQLLIHRPFRTPVPQSECFPLQLGYR